MLLSFSLIIHVLTVILWIGGTAFVTTVIFPLIYATKDPLQKVLLFQRVEHRYVNIARSYAVIAAASGFLNLFLMGFYRILFTWRGIGLTLMVLVGVFWLVLLFGLEGIVIKRLLKMAETGERDPNVIFGILNRFHWVLLTLSLAAAAGGISFAHGIWP